MNAKACLPRPMILLGLERGTSQRVEVQMLRKNGKSRKQSRGTVGGCSPEAQLGDAGRRCGTRRRACGGIRRA